MRDVVDPSSDITIKRQCEMLGVNRTSLYYKPKKIDDEAVDVEEVAAKEMRMRIIDEVHTDLPASGARKMAKECTRRGYPTTRHRAGKLMEEMNVRCMYPHPNLSVPAKGRRPFPYLLRNKRIWLPNQVWATDITYLPTEHGHMYLTSIIDLYSRTIVGWEL